MIYFSKISEREGTIEFEINKFKLFLNLPKIILFEKNKNKTVFVLDRILEN